MQGEEWHHCGVLVEECRILFIFGIWHIISLAGAQGLAPALDMPRQGVTQKKLEYLAHKRTQREKWLRFISYHRNFAFSALNKYDWSVRDRPMSNRELLHKYWRHPPSASLYYFKYWVCPEPILAALQWFQFCSFLSCYIYFLSLD